MGTAVLDIDIADRVRGITSEVLRIDASMPSITADTNLYEMGLESLNVVELITRLEVAYEIVIDVEDLTADMFSRFGTLVDFIQRKTARA